MCIVSIDPPGCKDIDDALHARDLPNGNIEVGIHIADVTYYMKHNSALDKEVRQKSGGLWVGSEPLNVDISGGPSSGHVAKAADGEFVLAGGRRGPLRVQRDRGDDTRCRGGETTLREDDHPVEAGDDVRDGGWVKGRYAQAQEYLDRSDDASEIGHGIHLLFMLSKKLKAKRIQAGALTLSSPEVRFQLDDEKNDPLSMDSYKLKDTNSLVEEFMLLGNCLVAKRIVDAYPKLAILRRHPVPDKS